MKINKFLTQSPLFAFYLAGSEVVETFQARLRTHDVHLLQGLILTAMFFEERPVRPSELSRVLQVQRSTLSHALRGLERKGCVRRDLLASDARGYALTLTVVGRRKAVVLVKEFDTVQQGLESALGPRRIRDMVADIAQTRQVYSILK